MTGPSPLVLLRLAPRREPAALGKTVPPVVVPIADAPQDAMADAPGPRRRRRRRPA